MAGGSRRRRALMALGTVVVLTTWGGWWITGTDGGRRWLVAQLTPRLNAALAPRGRLRLGTLRTLSRRVIELDSLELVDAAGAPVLQLQHLSVSLDWSALTSRRIHLRRLAVDGVVLAMQKTTTTPWNLLYILAGDSTPPAPGPGFGDDVRVDSLQLTNAAITITAPWAPHPIFQGAARDSVIAAARTAHDLRPVADGWAQVRRITIGQAHAHAARFAVQAPDSTGLILDAAQLTVSDPAVTVTDAAGVVSWTPETMHFTLSHFAMPRSTARLAGMVDWHHEDGLRYDVRVEADAALADLQWIWPALPDSGRGVSQVHARTLADADHAAFTLSGLSVASGASRLAGGITVAVGPTDLALSALDLTVAPITTELMRRLSDGALPEDVRGLVRGRLQARAGGPLSRFVIDDLSARFTDAAAGNATSWLHTAGIVALGAVPAVRNVQLHDLGVDLRTVRRLIPDAPPVDGVLRASARIPEASARGVEMRGLSATWTDGVGTVSQITGDVRVEKRRSGTVVALDLTANPLAMQALARVDTTVRITAPLSGRVTASGSLDSLAWSVALATGQGAPVTAAGVLVWLPQQWRLVADGAIDRFDVSAWMGAGTVPATALTGTLHLAADGTRDRAGAVVLGDARVQMATRQVEAADRPAFDLVADATIDRDRLQVDSALLHLAGITVTATGGLARVLPSDSAGVASPVMIDTLQLSARIDSLEAVGRQLAHFANALMPVDSAAARQLQRLAADTLHGDATLAGDIVGTLDDATATWSLGARALQVGSIRVGRIFGSARVANLLTHPVMTSVATADDVEGIGALHVSSAEVRTTDASASRGGLAFDASSATDEHLIIRARYDRQGSAFSLTADSLDFRAGGIDWLSTTPLRLYRDSTVARLEALEVRSSQGGRITAQASLPATGGIAASAHLERFPAGQAAELALGTPPTTGFVTGDVALQGTRAAPRLTANFVVDSLGQRGTVLPRIVATTAYTDGQVSAEASMQDTTGGRVTVRGRMPYDLTGTPSTNPAPSPTIAAQLVADSLRLEGLGLVFEGVERLRGAVNGQVDIAGTLARPVATGRLALSGAGARLPQLGIEPSDGAAQLVAAGDSVVLEQLRFRSGRVGDTLGVRGVLRLPAAAPASVSARMEFSSVVLAKRPDGTTAVLGGGLSAEGPLTKPVVNGALVIPRATLVIDPLGAGAAIDLAAAATANYLTASELPLAQEAGLGIARIGDVLQVDSLRVDLGTDVWVKTPEATVKLGGSVGLTSRDGVLVPLGQITANRGQYRLDLGVVSRSFRVDSGTVRFFGQASLSPAVDLTATNVVRLTSGEEIPVRVQVGGTLARPVVKLSSTDPLYSSAPESEVISLLIFGAPTFALDGQSQSTVRAVTGVLLPSVGGAVEGALQRLLPVFNTVQVTTAGGQARDDLTPYSLLDNLSISAGKQIGERTFLRLNTGVCRGSAQSSFRSASIWYGVAAEYRLARGLSAQLGVDPGTAPCSRVGGDLFPRMQFGFDLFKDWIF